MTKQSIFVTGPRLQYLGGFDEYNSLNQDISLRVYNELYDVLDSYEKGTEVNVYIGVEQGVEQWAIKHLISMKENFNVKVHLLLPYRQVGSVWPTACQKKLEEFKGCAETVTIVDEIPEFKSSTARDGEFSKAKVLNLVKYGIEQVNTAIIFITAECNEVKFAKDLANTNKKEVLVLDLEK